MLEDETTKYTPNDLLLLLFIKDLLAWLVKGNQHWWASRI
jgi:hypothetical protein